MAINWTPITQTPPHFETLILAVKKHRIGGYDVYIDLGYYDTNIQQWRSLKGLDVIHGTITHYMPLPPLPETAQYQHQPALFDEEAR